MTTGAGHGSPDQWEETVRDLTFLEHLLSDWFIGGI